MSTEEVDIHERAPSPDVPEPSDGPVQMHSPPPAERKRPKLDLGDRKRGKSMFGILLGTLNKARSEDKERSASEAAKRRALLEQRLASKLRSESDSVRKQESSKKQKSQATRMEEDLCVKDSIYKLRYKRLPTLAGFLCTADKIPDDADDAEDAEEDLEIEKELTNPPRSHPPPLYYLPAVLLPRQEKWIKKRKERVTKATTREHELFLTERTEGIEKIQTVRKEAEAEAQAAASVVPEEKMDTDEKDKKEKDMGEDVEMDTVGEGAGGGGKGDDAVEY